MNLSPPDDMTKHTTSNETSRCKAPQWGDLPDEETMRAPDVKSLTALDYST